MKKLSEKELIEMLSEATISCLKTLNESVWVDGDSLWRELKNLFPDKQLYINVNDETGEVVVEDELTGDIWYGYGEETRDYAPTGFSSPTDRDSEDFETITAYDYEKTLSDLKTRIEAGNPDKRGDIQEESFEVTLDELKTMISESVKRVLNMPR